MMIRHLRCLACGVEFTQPRRPHGRPALSCSDFCRAIHRRHMAMGRWPTRKWFEQYALRAGWMKLPKWIEPIAAGAPAVVPEQQRLLP